MPLFENFFLVIKAFDQASAIYRRAAGTGVEEVPMQSTVYTPPIPPPTFRIPEKKATSPYQTLGLADDAPKFVVEAAYRAMAKKHHPDSGGDVDSMKDVNAAFEEIKARRGWAN